MINCTGSSLKNVLNWQYWMGYLLVNNVDRDIYIYINIPYQYVWAMEKYSSPVLQETHALIEQPKYEVSRSWTYRPSPWLPPVAVTISKMLFTLYCHVLYTREPLPTPRGDFRERGFNTQSCRRAPLLRKIDFSYQDQLVTARWNNYIVQKVFWRMSLG